MTIPKLTPFEAIVCGGLRLHATPTSAKYPMPAATRPRIFRNRGAARSEPRLPVAILWVIKSTGSACSAKDFAWSLAALDIDGF